MSIVDVIPPSRPGHPAPAPLIERRAALAALPPRYPPTQGVTQREQYFGAIRALSFTPAAPDGTLLYLHGGGYRMGSPDMYASFAAHLAGRLKQRVILPHYGLAPEQPFPNGLRDALSVYVALGEAAPTKRVWLGGDSAGGGLAVALTHVINAAGLVKPRGLVLFSPWLDLRISAPSYAECAESDPLFPRESAQQAAALYLQGHPAEDPLASPGLGAMEGLPPTLLFASSAETLRDDSVSFCAKLVAAKVPVALHVVPGMHHVWPTLYPDLPETQHALETMRAFLAAPLIGA